ncbi:MDR family MFS transporter [Desulfitobacterium metallireducens]|uniref:Major facilitator superfamily (MFS) profile domain-containing protein n=1 Tax=Desulfitobacterium metallireducens DSM 15288 TaxID=871968 RepID=W0EG94_9FIRM|nr:MFS transporter [Desulfitobacterium metallireducens]AHF08543.1 hypothetical protein DESME_08350 [Desulfitobacterium metallireducens DSM 15288]
MGLSSLWKRYDSAIWIRVVGTILTTVTSFAIRPFLAIYLYDKTGSIYTIGIILGLAPLMGVITNLLGGSLADKYGRKPLMVYSLFFQALSMAGYIFAVTPLQFALVSIVNGIAASLYYPAANAQIADIVPEHQRSEVFALMHTALNVGAAVGPMLGLLLVKINQSLAFFTSALSLLIYTALVFAFVPETLNSLLQKRIIVNNEVKGQKDSNPEPKPTPFLLKEHRFLLLFTLYSLPINLLYSQVESNFPIYLRDNFENYLTIFTSLMSLNGIIVVLSAVWLAKKTEKLHTPYVLSVGYLLFAIVALGYGFGPWAKVIPLLFIAEIIFTIGEGLTFPNQNKLLSLMAPPEMRARYFSIFSLNWGIAKSLGPILGATLFAHWGGLTLFIVLSGLLLLSGLANYVLTEQSSVLSKKESVHV